MCGGEKQNLSMSLLTLVPMEITRMPIGAFQRERPKDDAEWFVIFFSKTLMQLVKMGAS